VAERRLRWIGWGGSGRPYRSNAGGRVAEGRVARARGDRGDGVIGALFGLVALCGFLLVAATMLIHLLAETSVRDEAQRVAERAASAPAHGGNASSGCSSQIDVLRAWLAAKGDVVTASCSADPDWVVVRASVRPRSALPALDAALGITTLDATARARVERPR
jgi:hypothetical protein